MPENEETVEIDGATNAIILPSGDNSNQEQIIDLDEDEEELEPKSPGSDKLSTPSIAPNENRTRMNSVGRLA